MLNRRSVLMSGAAAVLATALPAFGQEQEEGMVLRRPPRPGEDEFLFHFSQRGRLLPAAKATMVRFEDLEVVFHYPRYTYSGRLVVFSHGALADPQIYRLLFDHWVSHGFVVAAPVHDDSIFQRGLLARRSIADGSGVWEIDKVLNDSDAWLERCRACLRPLDSPDLIGETLGMRIDASRPIIMGHEFGAFVTALMMGAKVTASDGELRDFSDSRWFAGGMLSPQGSGIMGLDENSWSGITRPLLMAQGALESDFTGQVPASKVDGFYRVPAGNKHLAWFPHGGRLMFNGPRSVADADSVEDFENVCALTAAFLDAYGNYRAEIFTMLAEGWLDRATSKKVETRYR